MRLRALLLLCFVSLSGACSFWPRSQGHNLLFIVVDGLRFDAISSSVGAARTPNLQRLAADGVSFKACFSHSSASLPAHAAMLSSRLPHETGAVIDAEEIDVDVPLLAQVLAERDYVTLGMLSDSKAWFRDSARSGRSSTSSLERGFANFECAGDSPASAREVNDWLLPKLRDGALAECAWFAFVEYSDPQQSQHARDTAKATAEIALDGRNLDTVTPADAPLWKRDFILPQGTHRFTFSSDQPFNLVRFRCEYAGEPLELAYEAGRPDRPSKAFVVAVENPGAAPMACELSARIHDVPDLSRARERYKREVESFDRALGEILNELARTELYDSTCIVLTSGHGEALGEHADGGPFATLYDERLRVPLIIKPPKDYTSSSALLQSENSLVRHIDLAPTVLDILDLGSMPKAQGQSILERGDRLLVAEVHPPQAKDSMFALRDDRYKMVFTPAEDRYEMYDSLRDTLELENIFMVQGHLRTNWQKTLRQLAKNIQGDARIGWSPPPAEVEVAVKR